MNRNVVYCRPSIAVPLKLLKVILTVNPNLFVYSCVNRITYYIRPLQVVVGFLIHRPHQISIFQILAIIHCAHAQNYPFAILTSHLSSRRTLIPAKYTGFPVIIPCFSVSSGFPELVPGLH